MKMLLTTLCSAMLSVAVAQTATRPVVLRANALVALQTVDPVGSNTSQRGSEFRLVVSEDVLVDGVVVIPAGTPAIGEVIHAAKSGILGRSGELTITSRYLTVGERRIALRSLSSNVGQDRTALVMGTSLVVPLVPMFVRGKQVIVPAKTELVARVAADEEFLAEVSEGPKP